MWIFKGLLRFLLVDCAYRVGDYGDAIAAAEQAAAYTTDAVFCCHTEDNESEA